MVKNLFGLYFRLFSFKLYRQKLSQVNTSQLLLKLESLDKLRLVTFLKTTTQRKHTIITVSYQFTSIQEKQEFSWAWLTIEDTRRLGSLFLLTQLSFGILSLLCETISLSHYYYFNFRYMKFPLVMGKRATSLSSLPKVSKPQHLSRNNSPQKFQF